jgi:hypothetical protein
MIMLAESRHGQRSKQQCLQQQRKCAQIRQARPNDCGVTTIKPAGSKLKRSCIVHRSPRKTTVGPSNEAPANIFEVQSPK